MDWNKCALCQRSSNNLVDHSKNKNVDIDGYSKLAENINLFVIDDLPFPPKFSCSVEDLKGQNGIAANLREGKCHAFSIIKHCPMQIHSSSYSLCIVHKEVQFV